MAVVLGMTACNEKEEKAVIDQFSSDEIAVQIEPPSNWTTYTVLGVCQGVPLNCMPEVVVIGHPVMEAAKAELVLAFNNGPSAISNYFTSGSYDVLFPELDNQPAVLAELQTGNYQGVILSNSGTDHYLLGHVSLTPQELENNPYLVLRTK